MRGWGFSVKSLFFLSVFAVSCQIAASPVSAAQKRHHPSAAGASYHSAHYTKYTRIAAHGRVVLHGRHLAYARRRHVLRAVCPQQFRHRCRRQCLAVVGQRRRPVYSRGSVPEPGSVLTFRPNGRMRLGHVAVVSRVINPREIEVEHANWWGPGMYGGVAHNIPVVDVSEANDWTAVRVGLSESGKFGSVYPTYGFIYDRPDTGVMVASRGAPAPQPELNPAPSDLRPAANADGRRTKRSRRRRRCRSGTGTRCIWHRATCTRSSRAIEGHSNTPVAPSAAATAVTAAVPHLVAVVRTNSAAETITSPAVTSTITDLAPTRRAVTIRAPPSAARDDQRHHEHMRARREQPRRGWRIGHPAGYFARRDATNPAAASVCSARRDGAGHLPRRAAQRRAARYRGRPHPGDGGK